LKLPRLLAVFLLTLGTSFFFIPLAVAVSPELMARDVTIICANPAGETYTALTGWDADNSYFEGKGDIARLFCEGGFIGEWTTYISDNYTGAGRYYNGIAPTPAPSPSPTQTPAPEPSASPEPTPTPSPEPSPEPSPTPSASATPLPSPSPTPSPESPAPEPSPTPPVSIPELPLTILPQPEPQPQPLPIPIPNPEPIIPPQPEPEPPVPVEESPAPAEEPPVPVEEPLVPAEEPPVPVEEPPAIEEEPPAVAPEPPAVATKDSTPEEREAIAETLIEAADGEAVTADAIKEAGLTYEDLPPETPVEVRQDEDGNEVVITAEVAAALVVLESPAALVEAIFTDPAQALLALASIGADMSTEEREESEKIIIASVIAGQAAVNAAGMAGAAAAYRRKP
jgi:hypothetical protein